MSNSIETAIAIAIFGTIAIGIAIAKAILQLHTVSNITVAATRVRALPSTEALLSVI